MFKYQKKNLHRYICLFEFIEIGTVRGVRVIPLESRLNTDGFRRKPTSQKDYFSVDNKKHFISLLIFCSRG